MQQTRGRQMEAVFSCMWVSSLVKVYPDQMPQEMAEKSLVALKKESVSVQIAYRYAGEREEFGEVKMQLLWGGKEISSPGKEEETAFHRAEEESIRCKKKEETAPCLRIRQVNLVPCAYPCHPKRDEDYDRTKPGLYPDLLRKIPEEGFPLIPGQHRALWLDVDVPEGAPAGRYEIRVQEAVPPPFDAGNAGRTQSSGRGTQTSVSGTQPSGKGAQLSGNGTDHGDENPAGGSPGGSAGTSDSPYGVVSRRCARPILSGTRVFRRTLEHNPLFYPYSGQESLQHDPDACIYPAP